MDENSDAKALGAQKKSSKIWSVARICIAILAVVVILNLIQYDDMLAKDDLKFEILEVTESHYRITDADDNALTVTRPLTDSEYKFSPGAITVFRNMSVAPAVYAMLVFAAVPVLIAVRWQILLKAQRIDAPFLLVFKLTYAGIIMNFFLVGTTGGDVVKAFWLSQIKGKRAAAFVSVFVDRFLGLSFIIIFAGILVLCLWKDPLIGMWATPIGLLFIALALAVLILFSARVRRFIRFDKWSGKLPGGSIIEKIDEALLTYRKQPRSIFKAFAITLVLQLLASTSGYFVGRALGIEAAIWYYWLYVPLAFLVGSIPISFWGIGLLEFAYCVFFAEMATTTQATMLAVGIRLVQLLWALPGAYVLATGINKGLPQDDQL